jgi:hypothetical protein
MTNPAPPLSQSVRIRAGFSRSINLVRDQDSVELLRTYVPTSRAIAALEQLVGALVQGSVGRALALIGPYGAGKSAFGLFAGALLSAPAGQPHQSAIKTLQRFAPALAQRVRDALGPTAGMLRVQINGIPEGLFLDMCEFGSGPFRANASHITIKHRAYRKYALPSTSISDAEKRRKSTSGQRSEERR